MISYALATRNAVAAAVAALVDAGSGNGKIRIFSANKSVLLADITLPKPAFGSPVDGEVGLSALSEGVVVTGGVAAEYELTDSDNNAVISGDVGVYGSDLNLKTVLLTAGDVIEVEGFTYVSPD